MELTALTSTGKPASIENFVSLVELGVSFWVQAGEEFVRLVDRRPQVYEEIMEAHTWATRELLENFELIGRRKLHPKVLFMPKHVAGRLAGLSYDDQVHALKRGIPVVQVVKRRGSVRSAWDRRTDGAAKAVAKPAEKLTPHEARLAIGPGGIRTAAEQMVEAQKNYKKARFLCGAQIQVMNGKVWIKKLEQAPDNAPRITLGKGMTAVVRLMVEE